MECPILYNKKRLYKDARNLLASPCVKFNGAHRRMPSHFGMGRASSSRPCEIVRDNPGLRVAGATAELSAVAAPRGWFPFLRERASVGAVYLAHLHIDGLDLAVMGKRGDPVFTADARLLVAAERHFHGRQIIGIDPACAGLDLAGSRDARGKRSAVKTPAARPNSLSLARAITSSSSENSSTLITGPKDFLACDGHSVGNICKDRRLDEEALIEALQFRHAAATGKCCAFRLAFLI